jgi:hypothetical protein
MNVTLGRAAWFAMAIGSLACGGGDAKSGVSTGLPSQQKLSTLDDDEVKQACRSVQASAAAVVTPEAVLRVNCVTLSLQSSFTYSNGQVSVDVNKCQQSVDTCVSSSKADAGVDAGEEASADDEDCDDASSSDVKGCDATVGEYESCFNAMLGEMQSYLNALTCQNAENLSKQDESEYDFDPAAIPACKSLRDQCPETELGIPFGD